MSLIFLVPTHDLITKIVVTDFSDQLGLHAKPADGDTGVRDRPAADDNALAHINHLTGDKYIGHLFDRAVDRESWDQVQADMARSHDINVFPFHFLTPFVMLLFTTKK